MAMDRTARTYPQVLVDGVADAERLLVLGWATALAHRVRLVGFRCRFWFGVGVRVRVRVRVRLQAPEAQRRMRREGTVLVLQQSREAES